VLINGIDTLVEVSTDSLVRPRDNFKITAEIIPDMGDEPDGIIWRESHHGTDIHQKIAKLASDPNMIAFTIEPCDKPKVTSLLGWVYKVASVIGRALVGIFRIREEFVEMTSDTAL
jgi:hypothetical protein